MAAPNRSPMRVLIRPPSSSSITPSSTTTVPPLFAAIHQRPPPSALPPLPPPPSTPFRQNGIVVVGFIGRRKGDVSQLINRIIDANVFGSGDADVALGFEKTGEIVTDEVKDWFRQRQISYYHEETKGVLYLQFCSTKCPVMVGFSEIPSGFDSVFEKQDFGDLQGMLFMFSVCHVVIFIQEGSHFDIQILKKFRVLQGAKHAMFPFKSQTLQSRSHTSSSSHTSPSRTQTKNHSPNKNGPPMARNSSSATLMSGLGSYNHTSLFPGQCTPVILFVFLDDINETGSSTSNPDESTQSSNLVRPKGSGPVVVLSRPVTTKPEGGCGFKKKLQSSLEAQIRFSIKKCRVLSGSETGPPGSRNGSGPISNHMPLFSLDGSKAVLLLDKPSNNSGESLEFATSIVENVLEGISTSDSLLLETHSQSSYKEDIVSLKEFIYRQCDILRGRGGASVSGGGGGMVAVAAAAAAASVASGKPPPLTPDLPSLDVWLTSSQTILHGLLSAKLLVLPESEQTKRRSRNRNNVSLSVSPAIEGGQPKVNDPLELAATYLDNSKGLNSKFSISWCQRALPIAKDVYLHDLPPCYPTSQHESHLSKALTFFKSMVKGPAVDLYLKKLETECISIWISGRQLCDAVSLTGKSCTHQRHDDNSLPHCSGFVFLHACACGRSRKLRLDPFDFETANVTFSCYPECDKLLPTLTLPEGNNNNIEGPIKSKSWSLTRIGGSRYYQPSKGLLQSGFSNTDKFLQKWKFFLEKHKEINQDSRVEDVSVKKTGVDVNSKFKNLDDSKSNNSTNSVPNFTMKKPFSEVVAGSSSSTSSGFPPLQLKKKSLLLNLENVNKEKNDDQDSKKVGNMSSFHEDGNGNANGNNSFLQRGNFGNLLNINGRENNSLNQVVVYIGFEHECPCGHRFILTPDHLKGLGSIYAMDESVENRGVEMSKIGKHGGHNSKINRHTNRMANPGVSKVRNPVKSRETASNGNQGQNGHKDIEGSLQSMILDDDGNGVFPLLNRNLPLYLNCPHCQIHKNKNDPPNVQFAGNISQLQRIFLVTPPFPVVMSTCPVIQFEVSCVPPSVVVENEKKVEFSLGCPVILPPESFLSLRLPFVYGVKVEDGSFYPLRPFESQPELTAWLTKGTALQVLSKGGSDVM